MTTKTKKRVSNNPYGRPKIDDKKILVGIYIQDSIIQKKGGKAAVRDLFAKAIKR